MLSGYPFIPGTNIQRPSPLSRFLPSIPEGVVSSWLYANETKLIKDPDTARGKPWILDPFGADPKLAVEIARCGYRVLVAANNPILRFLIELSANPPTEDELRSILAELASTYKGDERLELHIQSLYQTECIQCGSKIQAEAYLWDRGAQNPYAKIYTCTTCGDNGERQINQEDINRLAMIGPAGLHRARALERVTSIDDPDRHHAEEALDSYLPRSIYILFSLINKIDHLQGSKRLLSALLLTTFDQSNSLWPYPTVRARPRLLTIPTHFRENNIWMALENSIYLWTPESDQQPVPFTIWPETPPDTGGVCIFEGRIRDLFESQLDPANQLDTQSPKINIGAVITALPRPNQAFWTLSALWAGWLQGREAAAQIKSVLRRRRYDWSWHCTALSAAFESVKPFLLPGTPIFSLISEAESGFLSAALLAGGKAGFNLKSIAIRSEIDQAQISWELSDQKDELHLNQGQIPSDFLESFCSAGLDYLFIRNEPSDYIHLLSTALSKVFTPERLIFQSNLSPGDIQSQVTSTMQQAFAFRGGYLRFGGSEHSLDVGQWWIKNETRDIGTESRKTDEFPKLPLSDRVEMAVVNFIQKNPGHSIATIDSKICELFTGLLTPEYSIIEASVYSYSEEKPPASNLWQLRSEDHPKNRRDDLDEMKTILFQIGKNIGFQIETNYDNENPIIIWKNINDSTNYLFYIQVSALSSRFLLNPKYPVKNSFLVIPGGRSGLMDYKIRHDPRLALVIEAGLKFIKFRTLRRLIAKDNLTLESLDDILAGDSIMKSETQIPLL